MSASVFTRRCFALSLPALSLAQAAHGAPTPLPEPAFPLRFGYVRITASGLARIGTEEQAIWSAMRMRLGGLVADAQPLQAASLLGVKAPELDGGASCVLVARAQAAEMGLAQLVVYATDEKARVYPSHDNWFSKRFASLRSRAMPHHPATGEAHLLDVGGGGPLLSAFADAPPRQPLNPFDNHRRPEHEALVELTEIVERRLQVLAQAGFDATRSRAD